MLRERDISDINLDLGIGNVPELLYGKDAIEAQIDNCLGIAPGERDWWPNFAVDLRRYLFSPITQLRVESLQLDIAAGLAFALPFIQAQVSVSAQPGDTYYDIVIFWVYNGQTGVYSTGLDAAGGVVAGLGGGTGVGTIPSSGPQPIIPIIVPPTSSPRALFSVLIDGLTATITDLSSDVGSIITGEHWDFGDGSTSATVGSQSYTYAAAGSYAIALTVMDALGNTATFTASVTIASGGGGGGVTLAERMAAAVAAATADIAVGGEPFWTCIGDATGILWQSEFGAGAPDPTALMSLASASKMLFQMVVAQTIPGLVLDDCQYLDMTSGYTGMTGKCAQSDSINSCLMNTGYTTRSALLTGYFVYGPGHFENYAATTKVGLGPDFAAPPNTPNLTVAYLAAFAAAGLVAGDMRFSQPLLAGGVSMKPLAYAKLLQATCSGVLDKFANYIDNPLTGPVQASDFFGVSRIRSPAPANQPWYYRAFGSWQEPDGTLSSAGAFGFYPWISADRSLWGIVARSSVTTAGELGFVSVQTGQAIRNAWLAGAFTATPGIALAASLPGTIQQGTPYTGSVTATIVNDVPGPLTVTVDTLPAGLTLGATVDNGDGTYTAPVTGTPTTTGTLTSTFNAGNGTFSSAAPLVHAFNVLASGANVPPDAEFTFVATGLTVDFTDTSTDSDGTIVSRLWNFGDSNTSTATNPIHTYASANTYTVSLTVTDNGGAPTTKTHSVTVTAGSIVLSASLSGTIAVGSAYTGTVTATRGGGATGPVTISKDTLPAGLTLSSTVDNGDGTHTATVSGTPTAAGAITTTFSATNGTISATPLAHTFTVGTGTLTITRPIAVHASGSTSYAGLSSPTFNVLTNDLIVVKLWMGNNTAPDSISDSAGNTYTLAQASAVGYYGDVARIYSAKASANHTGNIVMATVTGTNVSASLNVEVYRGASSWTLGPVDTTPFGYGVGPKSFNAITTSATGVVALMFSDEAQTGFNYAFSGGTCSTVQSDTSKFAFSGEDITVSAFSSRVYAVNELPSNADAIHGVGVSAVFYPSGSGGGGGNIPPIADFSWTPTALSVAFTDASTDPDGSIASWAWVFGDGGTSTATNPSHTYAAAGTYTVTLTVTDNGGATDMASQSVTVSSGGGGSPGFLYATNFNVMAPNYTTHPTPPPKGGSFVDPNTGATIVRLTDCSGFANIGSPPGVKIVYSQFAPDNYNGARLLACGSTSGYFYVLDSATGNVQQVLFDGRSHPVVENSAPRWDYSGTAVDTLYYTGMQDGKLYAKNVSTGVETMLHDFSSIIATYASQGANGIFMDGHSDIDGKSRIFPIQILSFAAGGWYPLALLGYDRVTDTVFAKIDGTMVPNGSDDMANVPPWPLGTIHSTPWTVLRDGKYMVCQWQRPYTGFNANLIGTSRDGARAYPITFDGSGNPTGINMLTSVRLNPDGPTHGCSVLDSSGKCWWINQNNQTDWFEAVDPAVGVPGRSGEADPANYATTKVVYMGTTGWDAQVHFSAPYHSPLNYAGVLFDAPTDAGIGGNETFVFSLGTTPLPLRIAPTYHTNPGTGHTGDNYNDQHYGSFSQDGTKFYWASNWKNDAGQQDLYVIHLPPSWQSHIPGIGIGAINPDGTIDQPGMVDV